MNVLLVVGCRLSVARYTLSVQSEVTFIIGLLGSAILVFGSALQDRKTAHPVLSRKNQLFAVGNACMFVYAVMGYFAGGALLFILLQILIAVSTVLMLLDTDDRFDAPFIACAAAALIVYALVISSGMQTLVFVVGLAVLGIGFALNTATVRRNEALCVGSLCIAWFSYLVQDQIFLWLNVFFAAFSLLNAWKLKTAAR